MDWCPVCRNIGVHADDCPADEMKPLSEFGESVQDEWGDGDDWEESEWERDY